MKRAFLAVILAAVAALAGAASLGELFGKVKEQVKAGSWSEALATMEVLDVEAAKPGNEKAQEQLAGPLSFYRGVCDANLDNAAKAQADFETFLGLQANASIDDKVYSKKAVAAFAAAQKSIASAGPSIARAYAAFKAPAAPSGPIDAAWGDGPVVWLMTDGEKAAWAKLTTDPEREAFATKFWLARDSEDDHSFRTTFDKRVAFADANLTQDDKTRKRGSLTDRGMVFILLGPPTYGGRRPIKQGEDANENSGMSSGNSASDAIAMNRATGPGSTSAQSAALADRQNAPNTRAPESAMNFQEVWHYRKELLPKTVS
ncbi:MAG TPA: GWxTD domain-containing protein, partial [Thermoanaerobaculia bacterium]|nr:GWxTD domain-containing protein [Thermoanaerobaculia bacterium]